MSQLPTRILAISGSLRAHSSNSALLQAAASVAPADVEVAMFDSLDGLPYFNPDQDGDEIPETVAAFRAEIGAASGVLISSPEYAHGVPGVLKNALDWLVGSAMCEIVGKRVALLNASPRSTHAQTQLSETLRVMGARVVGNFTLENQLVDGIVDDSAQRSVITALNALLRADEPAGPSMIQP